MAQRGHSFFLSADLALRSSNHLSSTTVSTRQRQTLTAGTTMHMPG